MLPRMVNSLTQPITDKTGASAITDLLNSLDPKGDLTWLSGKVGLSISQLSRVVAGKQRLTGDLAIKLSRLFGVPIETFIPIPEVRDGE